MLGPKGWGVGISGGVHYSVFVRKSEEFFDPSRRIGIRKSIQIEVANLSRDSIAHRSPFGTHGLLHFKRAGVRHAHDGVVSALEACLEEESGLPLVDHKVALNLVQR